ncbi:MAG: hypothetical protein AAFX76_11665 [Planctomycetota bacterium]
MSDKRPVSDDDLLANAIPIDLTEDDETPPPQAGDDDDLVPLDLSEPDPDQDPRSASKIQVFGDALRKPHTDHWNRTPHATGTGAIHVKTFVAKLRLDAIDNLDEQVNQWLDAHPEYEVKFVTTSIGKLVGKISEDALFMNVWV